MNCLNCNMLLEKPNTKFCSVSCVGKYFGGRASKKGNKGFAQLLPRENRSCLVCGKIMDINTHDDRKYCSRECQYIGVGQKLKGRIAWNKGLPNVNNYAPSKFYKGGYREDLGHYVRSSWEADFARLLNWIELRYEYEKHTLHFKDGTAYRPDFYIPDTNSFYEIKGRMEKDNQEFLFSKLDEINIQVCMIPKETFSLILKLVQIYAPNLFVTLENQKMVYNKSLDNIEDVLLEEWFEDDVEEGKHYISNLIDMMQTIKERD